jgi:L-ascorbate metabolism protein UlaG (beta-lactamase superfamily)
MKLNQGIVTHIYHSTFVVETRNHLLIFDYIPNKNIDNTSFMNKFICQDKDILIFVTHGHGDHFDPVILKWSNYNPKVTYIISDDISFDEKIHTLFYMEKYRSLKLQDVSIETYGTTDKGLSYFVHCDGLNIYHAGDLNWWHWKKNAPKTQEKEALDYKKEVNMLKGKDIDIAFVPVDPRLEEFYYLGGEYFASRIKPHLLVPMHFRDERHITHQFSDKLKGQPIKDVKVWSINKPLEEYHYSKNKIL